jgi:hypothetical protein
MAAEQIEEISATKHIAMRKISLRAETQTECGARQGSVRIDTSKKKQQGLLRSTLDRPL